MSSHKIEDALFSKRSMNVIGGCLALVAALAALALCLTAGKAEAATTAKTLKIVVKPGHVYRAVIVGRNVTVTRRVECGEELIGSSVTIDRLGPQAKTLRDNAPASTLKCTYTVRIQAAAKHTGHCAVLESLPIGASSTRALACTIPASKTRTA